jgi:isopenicillin N synthase-like dioxygenase
MNLSSYDEQQQVVGKALYQAVTSGSFNIIIRQNISLSLLDCLESLSKQFFVQNIGKTSHYN